MRIELPELSLVLLIGQSGSGKSTFARRHFKPTEVISSDYCRALVSDDENDLAATGEAFDLLHTIVAKRLAGGRLTVVDATNVQEEARRPLIELARRYHTQTAAIVLNVPEAVCRARNAARTDRSVPEHVLRKQRGQLVRSFRSLSREGIRRFFELDSEAAVDAAEIVRVPLWTNRRTEHGPFDIIGDVHGCADELEQLLERLGYAPSDADVPAWATYRKLYTHPEGRRAIFVGDLVDRGPRVLDALQLARLMVVHGSGLMVPGNHDVKFMRALHGRAVQARHGLEQSLAEFAALPDEQRTAFGEAMAAYIDGLVGHFVLDDGRLVVAHAGMKESMQGRASAAVRSFALFGETTGETDEFGLPVRYNWAAEYRGRAVVVYGHTPVPRPEWLNHTINIDTGAVFGGALTALRYPEMELVSVPAARTYAEPARPIGFAGDDRTSQQINDDLLDIEDVNGKRFIDTRLMPKIQIRSENSAAALELMSRFAIDPRWLIYLPPTMSPPAASELPDRLEHPAEAFEYFRRSGVTELICERKHMGSRAVAIVCRDAEAARARFGTAEGEAGIIYTRTGRRFFDDRASEEALLGDLRTACTRAGLWERLDTTWAAFDCELMPWSAKAQALLREQYAAVGAAAEATLDAAGMLVGAAAARGLDVTALGERYAGRHDQVRRYRAAYRVYCWPVASAADLRLAPFHLLATEGAVHADKDHAWHLERIGEIVAAAPSVTLMMTESVTADLDDAASVDRAIAWWEELTAAGGEGMVVKPMRFTIQTPHGPVQPAIKCRGREYLRIIYGPEYAAPATLNQLRRRNVTLKRSLASREFALGIESLERFVRREPLRRVHECVFGVLALESEPVDPRL